MKYLKECLFTLTVIVLLALLFALLFRPVAVSSAVERQYTEEDIGLSSVVAYPEPPIVSQSVYCSCIKTARMLGLPIPPTPYAGDLRANIALPSPGDGILLEYSTDSHIAYITAITQDGYHILEGNYRRCQKTERIINFNDPHIRGFYGQVDEPAI